MHSRTNLNRARWERLSTYQKSELGNRVDFLAGKDESAWGEVVKMPKRKKSHSYGHLFVLHLCIIYTISIHLCRCMVGKDCKHTFDGYLLRRHPHDITQTKILSISRTPESSFGSLASCYLFSQGHPYSNFCHWCFVSCWIQWHVHIWVWLSVLFWAFMVPFSLMLASIPLHKYAAMLVHSSKE